jgi:hypothetical protein
VATFLQEPLCEGIGTRLMASRRWTASQSSPLALRCQTFRNPWILQGSTRVNLERPVLLLIPAPRVRAISGKAARHPWHSWLDWQGVFYNLHTSKMNPAFEFPPLGQLFYNQSHTKNILDFKLYDAVQNSPAHGVDPFKRPHKIRWPKQGHPWAVDASAVDCARF